MKAKLLAAMLAKGLLLVAWQASAQRVELHTRELVMNVINGIPYATVSFAANADFPVWDQEGRLTQADEYTNPEDLEIVLEADGTYQKGDTGWDITSSKVLFPGDDPAPYLGRGYYTITPSGVDGTARKLSSPRHRTTTPAPMLAK